MSLSGKVAIVTGSTSGIGLAIARALAEQGCHVMLNGFGAPEDISGLCRELSGAGATVVHHPADMRRPAEIDELVKATIARFGGLDILVNNAGIQHVAPVEEFPDERWDAIIAINLSSCFHAIQAALPTLRARGWGRIINIASTHGLVASGQKTAYVAAKHGVVGLTKAVAIECANSGVTCNAICPGWVLTPLVQQQIDARARAQGIAVADAGRNLLAEKQPQLQFTTPAQIAGAALFLCSDIAGNMQGSQMVLDGGWTAQ